MKYLLPLFLCCMLLCGCSRDASLDESLTALPAESLAGEWSAPEEYGGAVQAIPLNLSKIQGLAVFGEDLLLFSGQESTVLTLLDPRTMTRKASFSAGLSLDAGQVVIEAGQLSFYDPARAETVVLDATLQELRRIPAPKGVSGRPIFQGSTLYYCTNSQVQAWDLNTGIRRRIKEMHPSGQTLTGVLLDGAVLQCLVTEGNTRKTLFLSAQDGRLLRQVPGECRVQTEGPRYYASIPAGGYQLSVFGGPEPTLLAPEALTGRCFFLPALQGAVVFAEETLHYYDLPSGQRRCTLPLAPGQTLKAVEALAEGPVVFLTYDPGLDQDVLNLWDVRPGNPTDVQDSGCYVLSCSAAVSASSEALDACLRQAEALGQTYGVNILLGDSAAAHGAWAYPAEPEHLVPLIQQELDLLDQRLRRYPEALLKDTAAHFSSLNLCLVRSAAGPGCAAMFLEGTDAYVRIPSGSGAGQALDHGLFHVMETHIFSESLAFDHWDALNPAGFQYDCSYSANAARDSGVYLFQEGRAFVDTFSMSFPREDRARIFEYAMAPDQQALFLPRAMQAKLLRVCQGIREAYGLEGAYLWEQYLQ